MGKPLPKQFLKMGNKEILEHTIAAFRDVNNNAMMFAASDIFLTLPEEFVASGKEKYGVQVVPGGETRQESVQNAFEKVLEEGYKYVLIHDAARPFVSTDVTNRVVTAMLKTGAAVPVVELRDTVKAVAEGKVETTPDRDTLRGVQTPQGFDCDLLKRAFEIADQKGYTATDEASLVEMMGADVYTVPGDYKNFKITDENDLKIGEMHMAGAGRQDGICNLRIGHGFDVHKIVESRPMILGGVEIDSPVGLLGHSDADVLIHAIMDAMLGAANLPDIGQMFPNTDERYKGVSSVHLLKEVAGVLKEKNFEIVNIDATLMGERPKIAPLREEMIERISSALNLPNDRVNIKGTTTEKLGFTGRSEGLCAEAVVLLEYKAGI